MQFKTLKSMTTEMGRRKSSTCCESCDGKAFCSPRSGTCYDDKRKDYYATCKVSQDTAADTPACCESCGGKAFCSPRSGRGYDDKRRDYYAKCQISNDTVTDAESAEAPADGACCGNCGGAYPFCSPNSGGCYGLKAKEYYESCTVAQCPASQSKTIKVMSYNTEYRNYNSRISGYAAKIKEVAPALVGLQECQNRDGLASSSGYVANTQTGTQNYMLFDRCKVTFVDGGYMRIPRDNYAPRYITWGRFKLSNNTVWFFNTHLPHNHNEARSPTTHAKIAKMLLKKRRELGAENAPTIVVGDMNSHASYFNKVAGGGFESNLEANGFTWAYTAKGHPGHGGIDQLLYSTAHWTHSNCQDSGTGGSDHTSITCDLTLKAV